MIRYIRSICISLFVLSLMAFVGVSIYTGNKMDNTAPVISMDEEEITISVEDSTDKIFDGISAVDDKDGDVRQYLTLEKFSNFISPGTREATIAVFDNSGNVARVTRTVNYSDYTSPRVSVKEPLKAPLSNMTALLDKIQVIDSLDGDLTGNLQIVSEKSISTAVPGEYQMHLQVSNSAGDTLDMPVTVEFYNASGESGVEIQLTDYLIYVEKGKKVNPLDYLKQLNVYTDVYMWDRYDKKFVIDNSEDEDENSEQIYGSVSVDEISIDNPVDTSVPGTYEIQYSLQNSDSNKDSGVRLIVVVEEREDR